MRRLLLATLGLALAASLDAHRLDEYLQATLISVEADRAMLEVNLTPGVMIAERILELIDADRDGRVSVQEERAYAARVLRDLSLNAGRRSAPLELMDTQYPAPEDVRAGLGTIRLRLTAELPKMEQGHRELHFQNRHMPWQSVYLVNALVPPPGISITGQERDRSQTTITISYVQDDAGHSDSRPWIWALCVAALLCWLIRLG